jgi:hypothetical protein
MSFIEFLAGGVFGLAGIYVAARLVTAAFFQSKIDYERRKQHVR